MGSNSVKFAYQRQQSPPSAEESQQEKQSFSIVAAIDVGTYSSGYAYQKTTEFENNRTEVHTCKNRDNISRHKYPTCLMLKPDQSLDSFGPDAREKYYNFKTESFTRKPDDWKKYFYFENFKMMIYHRQDDVIRDDLPVEAKDMRTLPAIVVFSKTIEYLKNEIIQHFKSSGFIPRDSTDFQHIKWILTVPALWGDPARQLMPRAAIKAGILDACLELALEPECAAIYCSQLPRELLDIHEDFNKVKRAVEPGATIMVVDIGGGTTDISVMTIKDDGTIEQVHKSGGNGLGSVGVNNKLLQELKNIFGEEVMQEFCQSYPDGEQEIRDTIELAKCTWRKTNENEDFRVKLPSELKEIWKERNQEQNLKDHLQNHEVSLDGRYLYFDPAKIDSLFRECIEGIMKFLGDVMRDPSCAGHTMALLAVGGFSESNYLVSQLRERLSVKGIPVIRPENSDLAVLKGAVLYGQDDRIISSRVMQRTYGVAMTAIFDPERHLESERYTDKNGDVMANNVFRKHVEIGEKISIDKWIHGKRYNLNTKNKTERVYIFQSEKKNPKHTTENGCECIGYVDVVMPAKDEKEPNLGVQFRFSGTLIKVRTVTLKEGSCQVKTLDVKC